VEWGIAFGASGGFLFVTFLEVIFKWVGGENVLFFTGHVWI